MLSVPYSSMSLTKLSRRPVKIDAIAITVETPITMPRTVSALLNLCDRMLSSAIETISWPVTVVIFIDSTSGQRDDGVQPRSSVCRVNSCDHSDAAGHDKRQRYVCDRDRHGDWSRRPH